MVEVKKRGRKKKPEDPNFVKRPPLKRGPKKKLESEKKHRVYPWFVNAKFTSVILLKLVRCIEIFAMSNESILKSYVIVIFITTAISASGSSRTTVI